MAKHKQPANKKEQSTIARVLPPQRNVALSAQRVMAQAFNAYSVRNWVVAEQLCRSVLAARPGFFHALHMLGIIAAQTQRTQEAVELFRRAVAVESRNAAVHICLGNALQDLQRFEEAIGSYDRAAQLDPNYPETYNNRGNALQALGRWTNAIASYERAIALKPDYAAAYNSRGHALRELERSDEAVASYDMAIALNPNYAEAHSNRGNALQDLQRMSEAVASYDRALRLNPAYAEAHVNRANAMQRLRRLGEALASCDRAIALKPRYSEAHLSRGDVLQGLKRLDDAVESYDRAIELAPGGASAHVNRGAALQDLKRLDEARESYRCALELKPDHEFLLGAWIASEMTLNDWTHFDSSVSTLVSKVLQGEKAAQPFQVLAVSDCLLTHRKAAETWTAARCPMRGSPQAFPTRRPGDRIRIGYFSADYREHPVSHLTAGLFETHDRSRFELTAFSLGRNTRDEMRTRIEAAFEHFVDVWDQSDEEVAGLARTMGIDIAIDLGGFTQDSRTGIFALRAAPVQVNFLGYPGTMSAEYIDYLIADSMIIPNDHRQHYAEKIAYLPSYQPNDSSRRISGEPLGRSAFGLPETEFVFCCFNNNYKITPSVFDCWMRILKHVDGSVLWLSEATASAMDNLKREAGRRGVAPERLVFAKRMPSIEEHLARHRLADLFIDTLPYNAHATASNALWAGLPVLTCAGESFASRVAASLLTALRLPELITFTQAEYEALAIELATTPALLQQLGEKLATNRLASPLFDTQLFTKHIESAYTQMHERHHAGLSPDDLWVFS